MIFGRAMTIARAMHGKMTQDVLSAKTGIKQSQISRLENAEAEVSLDEAEKIAAAFDLTISELKELAIKKARSAKKPAGRK